ncbi:MAG: PQQ-binding-like beta-propeller repeat protein [Pirellula sp.]|jgi:outer membrane protein assembly factor BamB
MRQSLILKPMALGSLVSLGLGVLATFGSAIADDSWPQWRGPNRDGFAAPQSLLSKWPEAGPAVAWAYEDTGAGYSSVSVENGKVYTLGKLDGQATAICLDSKTGKKLWQTPFGDGKATYNTGWGDGPRGTPTVDGDFIYCVSDMGTVACLNKETGELVWAREFVKEFGGGVPVWGYSESPLIDGDRVVVTPGNKSFLIGLNKKTGETIWQSKPNYEAQYVSVIKAEFEGIPVYLTATKPGLVGIHAETGEELFLHPKTGNNVAVIPTPVVSENIIYHSSGYGAGCAALEVTVSGGKLSVKELYHNNKGSMENHHGGFVLHEGTVFGFSRANRGCWMAQDLKSGEVLWSEKVGKGASGSIGFADGHLYCYDDAEGICYLAKPSKSGWEAVGQVKLPKTATIDRGRGAIWAHPVIAEKKLFIRDQDKLFAFDIGE